MTFNVTAGSGSAVSEATFEYPPDPAYIGGVAFVYDENNGGGVIERAGADGSFDQTQPFPATLGDQVIVTVQLKEETESTCVVLQNGHQSAASLCQ